ncbi:FtsQ-type POTRA domain-containing protein [Microbacterium sp. DT81.1]|uniref:FtsQ-type POTRA domain-containing protein n=1 Tax=Microbacterium sp. DT81.1 TaxID=3393413 RepID=UPI003CF52017
MRRPTPLPVPARKAPEPAAEAPSREATGSVAVRARNEAFEPLPVIEPNPVTDATGVDEPVRVADPDRVSAPVVVHDPTARTEPIPVVGSAAVVRSAAVVATEPAGATGTLLPMQTVVPAGTVSSPGAPSEPSVTTETPARPGASPSATPDPEPDQVRLRDVWRASRARRKALRAEVRRFTVRARRRRAVWIGAAASLLLLVLGSLGAAYSPLFAVERIRILGAEQLDTAAVEAALADEVGTPLPLVDASAVKAALLAFPLIETYTLEARPPHDLVVRVVERTPIGAVASAAGFTVVDAAGVALSTTAAAPAGRPLITARGGVKSDAFSAVGLVMRSLPDQIRGQVTAVAATSPDDVTLTLGGTDTQVVWGSAEESAMKSVVLQTTMAARPPADVSVYDVSSPTAVVVR